MIVVDTSVWINFFNGKETPASSFLDTALSSYPLILGDIILAETLQGFRTDSDFKQAQNLLSRFPVETMMGPENAVICADNYRLLRRKGITIRTPVDIWIATFCIEASLPLLHEDRDFHLMAKHLPLESVV